MDLEKYRRIARALAQSQQMNAALEERVRQKQSELERNFEAIQRLMREAAVAEERQRIMTDMHDGIGAHLIAALSLAEGGESSMDDIATVLHECIDDLRLAIDSLEPTENELLPALGNFRYRVEKRLRAVGVELEWRVSDLPALPCLSPHNLLQILRILQEAFANVLKHAQATRIRLETGLVREPRQVLIRVSDNGKGFPTSAAKGRGLGNMARRAGSIGGELRVLSSLDGTVVELLLPTG